MMAKAMEKEGLKLTHVIGPDTAHKYHPDAIPEINKRIDAIVESGQPRHAEGGQVRDVHAEVQHV